MPDRLINHSNTIELRRTETSDLNFVLNLEHSEENSAYVGQQTREEHQKLMQDTDILHLVIEAKSDSRLVGYILLAGMNNKNKSIELRRIVICEKGYGFGREALKLCKIFTFEIVKAHRLWLDVRHHNQRAYHLYQSEGFVKEGILRECIQYKDEYDSLIVMSILENEYAGIQIQPK